MPDSPRRNFHSHRLLSLLLAAGTCGTALAHPPARDDSPAARPRTRMNFDAATGRDLLNYPPHRTADLVHQRLELVVPDMNVPQVIGTATITIRPVADSVASLTLHAADQFIKSATCEGRTVTFAYAPGDDTLRIELDPPVPSGSTADVRIEYELNDPAEGIIWTPESRHRPGRSASFHTQGEPESARYWFATFDFPSERLTSEVIVTVPAGYQAVSNGRLVSRELVNMPVTGADAVRFHYQQTKEHVPYLVSLNVGKWDVVDVAPRGGPVPMPVYVPVGEGDRVERTFGRTPAMVTLLERLFAEPYPWDQYAQVVVHNFAWGGMENTGATTLYETVALDQTALLDGDEDELILHELAHQWFGNLITCRSWEHIWLNEGWATYSEALWAQYSGNRRVDAGRTDAPAPTTGLRSDGDAYQAAIWSWYRDVIDNDHAEAPVQPGMVSKQYTHPEEVFGREANPYPKGASVLHMLRSRLGEETFWRGTHLYLDRHRNQSVETFQFRMCMEEVSGLSLQRFFDQWCVRPGVPHLKVAYAWDESSKTLTVSAEQTQSIDGPNPAFMIDLPIWIDTGPGRPQEIVLRGDDRVTTESITLPREPRMIVVDPAMTLLAEIDVEDAPARFAAIVRGGPTLASRLRAVRDLAQDPAATGIETLVTLARDERAHRTLRIEAVDALARLAEPEAADDEHDDATARPSDPGALAALARLLEARIDDARVRKAIVAGVGTSGRSADREAQRPIIASLMQQWSKDPSYAVRAECLRSLGKLKAVDAMKLLDAGLETESQHDQFREAAVDGWSESEFPDAFERVAGMTTPDRSRDVRQAAIRAVGARASQNPERAFNLLAALINDPDMRTRRVAVESLLKLDDPRARPTVEQWTDAARGRADRAWGRELIRKHEEQVAAETTAAEPAAP